MRRFLSMSLRKFMIALQCPRCGYQVEVSEAAPQREITCPRCKGPIAPASAADDSKTEAQPFPGASTDYAPAASLTHNENDNEETQRVPLTEPVETFAFLSAPTGPNELGW